MSPRLASLCAASLTISAWCVALLPSSVTAQSPTIASDRNAPPQWLDPWPGAWWGPFGRYELFPPQSTYYVPQQPIGHEITPTGPNGYTYRPVYAPPGPQTSRGAEQGVYLYPPSWPWQRPYWLSPLGPVAPARLVAPEPQPEASPYEGPIEF